MCKMTLSKIQVSLLLCGLALLRPCSVDGKYSAKDVDEVGLLCNASKGKFRGYCCGEKLQRTVVGKRKGYTCGWCFTKCMCEKLGMLDTYGKYSKAGVNDMLKKYWPETPLQTVEKVNNVCYKEALRIPPTELGTCNYSYKIKSCLNTEYKRYGMV